MFLYLEPVQRFENMVRIGGPGSCSNSVSKSILGVLGGDITASEKDNDTLNCSGEVWSKQKTAE